MRERSIHVILGAPGSGKTTLLRSLLAQLRRTGSRARILDPKRQLGGEWPGAEHSDAWIAELLRRNSDALAAGHEAPATLCVADDCDLYVPKHPPPASKWREVYVANRHFDLDLIVTARRPQSLSLELLSAAEYLWIFRLSPADVHGLERLREYVPRLPVPRERYRFVRVNLFEGSCRPGQTRTAGGYDIGPVFVP